MADAAREEGAPIVDTTTHARTDGTPQAQTADALLEQLLGPDFIWQNQAFKEEARQHAHALMVAEEFGFPLQQAIYRQKIVRLSKKDLAIRTKYMVRRCTRFDAWVLTGAGEEMRPAGVILINHRSLPYKEFQICQVAAFPGVIPYRALRVIQLLSQEGITPDGYWVMEHLGPHPPNWHTFFLCALFGFDFTSLAGW
jgi:hypothetical protein